MALIAWCTWLMYLVWNLLAGDSTVPAFASAASQVAQCWTGRRRTSPHSGGRGNARVSIRLSRRATSPMSPLCVSRWLELT
jgi:hypothetical protein